MNPIFSYMPSSSIAHWLWGVSMFPVEMALREIVLTVAKSYHLCAETQLEYYKKNFQKIEHKQNLPFLNQASKVKRFTVEKLLHLFQANNIALIEETILRFGLQDCLLTSVSNYLYCNREISEEQQLYHTILRVVATATLFGLLHYRGAEVRNEQKEKKDSKEEVRKERNFQVIGAGVSGIVYGAVYEWANQSLWASHGCHTMWNFFHDLIVSNTWQREPTKLEQEIQRGKNEENHQLIGNQKRK